MCTELTEGSFEQTVQLSKGLELLFYYILPCIYRLLASANLGNLLFQSMLSNLAQLLSQSPVLLTNLLHNPLSLLCKPLSLLPKHSRP